MSLTLTANCKYERYDFRNKCFHNKGNNLWTLNLAYLLKNLLQIDGHFSLGFLLIKLKAWTNNQLKMYNAFIYTRNIYKSTYNWTENCNIKIGSIIEY